MPAAALRPCANTRCPTLVPRGYCADCAPMVSKPTERPTAHERGYDSRWQKARKTYLHSHPLCVHCLQQKTVKAATTVDHIIPHRGSQALFWDTDNWQPLCTPCHNAKTAAGQ